MMGLPDAHARSYPPFLPTTLDAAPDERIIDTRHSELYTLPRLHTVAVVHPLRLIARS
jgi:hypothetical protein